MLSPDDALAGHEGLRLGCRQSEQFRAIDRLGLRQDRAGEELLVRRRYLVARVLVVPL